MAPHVGCRETQPRHALLGQSQPHPTGTFSGQQPVTDKVVPRRQQMRRAGVAETDLVRHKSGGEPSRPLVAVPGEYPESYGRCGDCALHVAHAKPVQPPLATGELVGRHRPRRLVARFHRVHVPVPHQVAAPGSAGARNDQVGFVALTTGVLKGEALGPQIGRQHGGDLACVAGRRDALGGDERSAQVDQFITTRVDLVQDTSGQSRSGHAHAHDAPDQVWRRQSGSATGQPPSLPAQTTAPNRSPPSDLTTTS